MGTADGRTAPDADVLGLVGKTINNKYQVERVLGQGGMGIIYAARHLILDKRYAIKFPKIQRSLSDPSAATREILLRFRREARLAAKLEHEAIVHVTEVDNYEGHPFAVMPLLDGESLDKRIIRGRLDPQE